MKIKTSILMVILITLSLSSVTAFRLTPMVQEFTPSGQGARQTFTVSNDGDRPIAVQIEFAKREIDINGNETLHSVPNLFLAFPQQMVVQPKSQQIVRVQWRGPSAVPQEQAYRIIARQLPVEFDQERRGDVNINIMFIYQGALYVTPPRTQVNLVINSAKRTYSEEGGPMLTLEAANTGNVHVIVENPSITLRSTQGGRVVSQVTLVNEELPGLNNVNILAGSRRVISIPWPDTLSEGDIDATAFTFRRR